MKTNLFKERGLFLCLMLCYLLTSCQKEKDISVKDIVLEFDELQLKPGEHKDVKILSGNSGYQVNSSNKDILQANVDGNNIKLTASAIEGDAELIVYIVDTKGATSKLNVTVSSYQFLKLNKDNIVLSQLHISDTLKILGGQAPFSIESSDPTLVNTTLKQDLLILTAKRRGQSTLKIKDARGTSSDVTINVSGDKQALDFSDRYFGHANFGQIAATDQSIRSLKQVTFEMTCKMQGYRGLQTFMGLEGRLIIRGKHDDYRSTHPIEISGLGDRIMLESTSNFNLNEWLNIALVVDCTQQDVGQKYKLFINGVQDQLIVRRNDETHTKIDLSSSNDGGRFVIGRANGQDWRALRGAVSEARVWTVARTAAQIKNNMCSLNEDKPQGLLAHWDFSSGISIDRVQDISSGPYQTDLILSDAKRSGIYYPIQVPQQAFFTANCSL